MVVCEKLPLTLPHTFKMSMFSHLQSTPSGQICMLGWFFPISSSGSSVFSLQLELVGP
jgi:hypothetical protein